MLILPVFVGPGLPLAAQIVQVLAHSAWVVIRGMAAHRVQLPPLDSSRIWYGSRQKLLKMPSGGHPQWEIILHNTLSMAPKSQTALHLKPWIRQVLVSETLLR